MDKDKRQDRIDDHLLGRDSREDRLELEEELARNADLRTELADTELAMAAIELGEDRALKARLQALESKLADTTPGTTAAPRVEAKVANLADRRRRTETRVVDMRRRRKGNLNLLGYAAALLLALAAGWWAFSAGGEINPGQLAMESFEPYDNIATGTVRGNDEQTLEAAAFADYDAGNYEAAAAKFKELPESGSNVNRFYLGQSLLAQRQYEEALTVFRPLMEASGFPLAKESAFYHAVAQLGSGDINVARSSLTRISESASHPLRAEAKALLAKM